MTSEKFPRSFAFLAAALATTGAAALLIALVQYPVELSAQLLLLLVGTLLAENFALRLPSFSVSLSFPLIVAAMALTGPAGAGVTSALCSTSYQEIRAHRPWYTVAYNFGQLSLSAVLGGWLYVLVAGNLMVDASGSPHALTASEVPRALAATVAAAMLYSAVNMLLTAVAIRVGHRQPFRRAIVGLLQYVPTQFALAFVGFLLAQVLAINPITLPLFIFPLAVARQLYERYASLKDAYVDTVRSLVGALEAKDPYTRGHSERVSRYALRVGETMGLDSRLLERLEYAALLHDLGKLAMPRSILAKPCALSDDESVAMRRHPQAGAEMVERIPPLRELADFVRQHHERFGGQGYPLGSSGDSIPLFSRILAVADSYDAMTTTRPYRRAMTHEEAVAELNEGAGTQFDPAVVTAFLLCEARVGAPEFVATRVGGIEPILPPIADGVG